MLLYALLAGFALAKKIKTGTVCFGKEDEDHFDCKAKDKAACDSDDKCTFGKDRVQDKYNRMKNCMEKAKAKTGEICEEQSDCKCGTTCYFHDWMGKSTCTMCMDHGVEEDCNAAADAMSCKWFPKANKGEGACMEAKNDCNELGKTECAKSKMCKYDKKQKSCSRNYVPSCVGMIEDTHAKCYEAESKEACADIKSVPFGKALCKWGFNKFAKEEEHKMCMKKMGMKIGEKCTEQADCRCGTKCFDFGFMKACSLCADYGTEDDCHKHADQGCKFVGKGEDVMCILSKDGCSENAFEKTKCEANKMCEYDTDSDKCYKKPVTKKTCKALSKKPKGEEVDMKAMKIKCQKVPQCKFVEKGGKGKCIFRKD